ncbi:MAG: AIPR family protein [Bacteroidales bacterium]|nr:AIPR family protein [Bacteroidales bacterium]
MYKIGKALTDLQHNKVEGFNEKLVTAYKNAVSQMEEKAVFKVVFFTSYKPRTKKEQNKIEKAASILKENKFIEDVEFNFGNDIEQQIESCDNQKLCVDTDKLEIDDKDNYLKYEESIIVNISARSLQDLQNRRRNGLLGMNLRYFIKQKAVDAGIADTIKKEPQNFWYKNNGLLIVCDDYKIDGKELKLTNFSIVNGGQTTNRIGNLDITNDFYLQCKVVKINGASREESDALIAEIAKATNSQKPIKKADIKANSKEQLELHRRLEKINVFYMTKKGDKIPSTLYPWQVTTLEKLGKIAIATVVQLPGTARSNSQRMYDDDIYYLIFSKTHERFLADSLKVSYYYDQFTRKGPKEGLDKETALPMVANGKTFQMACIAFLGKIRSSVFDYNSIAGALKDPDQAKAILRNMGDMEFLIKNKIDDEQECFFEIFRIIADEVLGYCYGNALEKATQEQAALAPSNYLKLDQNYFKDIIPRLWARYNRPELKKYIDEIL